MRLPAARTGRAHAQSPITSRPRGADESPPLWRLGCWIGRSGRSRFQPQDASPRFPIAFPNCGLPRPIGEGFGSPSNDRYSRLARTAASGKGCGTPCPWNRPRARLLRRLYDHSAQNVQLQYHHRWHTGDFVIWDNRATLHAATADYAEYEKRLMYRTAIKGRRHADASGRSPAWVEHLQLAAQMRRSICRVLLMGAAGLGSHIVRRLVVRAGRK
ncbi:MAG: hypothetical protein GEV05_30430 [Betaproteobacteria bacterium]|nr:hypothetical protein [Betaproteobacteria bacterium]